jgi:ribonucrease Y
MFDLVSKFFPNLKKERDQILEEAHRRADSLTGQAQSKLSELSRQIASLENKISKEEKRISSERKDLERLRQELSTNNQELEKEKKLLESKRQKLLEKFEKLAKLTPEQARENLLAHWEQKLSLSLAQRVRETEEQIKKESEQKAKEILVDAMRFGTTDYVVEYTLSTITLSGDEYKGRIIGKEGRNIRSFELATGVEVDLDEEGVVKLSSFDPVKREVARVSLLTLIKDGRIQPQRIEEVVKKTREDINKIIYKEGEKLCYDVKVYNLPKEITELLGRFKYRFSYGQNMIQHTLEETQIGVALAHELKADVNVVRLACLLHDIGKVIVDKEGSHVQLGVELLKKHRFPNSVIEAVETHHEDKPFTSVEGIIVYLADAVSGGRPGARREDVTEYIKRINEIENFIKAKEGVHDVAVLQAGREIRVIINPQKLNDDQTVVFCEKLRQDLQKYYSTIPGQIKLTAIREFRVTNK